MSNKEAYKAVDLLDDRSRWKWFGTQSPDQVEKITTAIVTAYQHGGGEDVVYLANAQTHAYTLAGCVLCLREAVSHAATQVDEATEGLERLQTSVSKFMTIVVCELAREFELPMDSVNRWASAWVEQVRQAGKDK